jgi:hypothetical protein
MSVQIIRFAPGLKPVLKHQEHDQSSHGNWANGEGGAVSELSDDDFREILYNTKTVGEMFEKIAKRLGKSMKPKVAELSEDDINVYRGVPNVDRDVQRLLNGKIRFTEFQTWGQGIYVATEKDFAANYGHVLSLKLDDSAKLVRGELAWADVLGVTYPNDNLRIRHTGTSKFIDMPRIVERVNSKKMNDLSVSDMTNVYWAAKGYDGFTTYGETVLFNGSKLTINKADIGTAVKKHQEHDQKTHGNWATLSGQDLIDSWEKENNKSKVPSSPANPEGLNSQGIKSWVLGPFRNFSANYPIQDGMRHIFHGILGLPLTPFVRFYSDRERYVNEFKLNEQVNNLIVSLDKAPQAQPTLWRGMNEGMLWENQQHSTTGGFDSLLNLKEGDDFVSPFFSTSRDVGIANMYGTHLMSPSSAKPTVIFRIEAGAKGLKTNIIPDDKEVLTGGKFKVVGVASTTVRNSYAKNNEIVSYDQPLKLISLVQVDTFGKEDIKNPTFHTDSAYQVQRGGR